MRQDESEAAITPSTAVSRLHVAFLLGPRTARWDEVNSVVELLSLRAPTVGDLPPPKTQRWVARRKGCGSYRCTQRHDNYEEALRRYHPTEEEFLSWQRAFEAHGLPGLRATRIQQYRGSGPPRDPRSRR